MEEREEEYKEQLREGGYPKKDILRKKHHTGKQYCEDCVNCIPHEAGLEYAKCKADPLNNYISKTLYVDYYHCIATRNGPTCKMFKHKNQTI